MLDAQNQGKSSPHAFLGAWKSGKLSSQVYECGGLGRSAMAFLLAQAALEARQSLAIVLPTPKEARSFCRDLKLFDHQSDVSINYLPGMPLLPGDAIGLSADSSAERIRTLYRLIASDGLQWLVVPATSLQQRLMPRDKFVDYAELVMAEEDLDRDAFIAKLIAGGYARSAIVEEPGDFSIRGGIIDVFSPLYDSPVRIELYGDWVESIRHFSAENQRTLEPLPEAVILPAREIIVSRTDLEQTINRLRTQAMITQTSPDHLNGLIELLKETAAFSGMERLMPLFYSDTGTLFDYLPDSFRWVMIEPDAQQKAIDAQDANAWRYFNTALRENRLALAPEKIHLSWDDLQAHTSKRNLLVLKELPFDRPVAEKSEQFHFQTQAPSYSPKSAPKPGDQPLTPWVQWLQGKMDAGFTIFMACDTPERIHHLESLLATYNLTTKPWAGYSDKPLNSRNIFLGIGKLSEGFEWPDLGLIVLADIEIFGKARKKRPYRISKARSALLSFEDLKQGDLVVHQDHGIGQYQGLEKLSVDGTTNDYLHLLYRDNDRLYLPVERMNVIQKYVGVEGMAPVLDKMGGTAWAKAKEKVKKSVEKIAGELLNIYAERKVASGVAFKIDDAELASFEAGFPYEETPDQHTVIEEILRDMADPSPMDRLVCGDVGYGKTEIALRAAFTAVYGGKQVAVVVPTTVLAEQHYQTFSQRFEAFPVRIACLSRFRTPKVQRQILEEMKDGKIDIVIGTHRLLQKDVAFKDLGLIVLDEEHRFGVRHKERLKKIKRTVDVLALTATPIPRTLHMSLTGIRDISVLSTPPEQRRAIATYIAEWDDAIIADGIRRELDRNGQIYFVHNTIQSIHKIAARLQKLVPEVRLDIAHGRMNGDELEKTMLRFVEKELDLLVCTTLIESGLDIPAANTIMINRADRLGLAQIYQLRGRVGRADEQAYAYLFVPGESNLTKDARKRLKVLMEHTDLGAGFQIAMSDLKIRGGGTLLGPSQSGHIAAVGYDMFLKLMEEAVNHLKGEFVCAPLEPEVNVTLSAFIPETYIPDIDQRLTIYRRLSGTTAVKEVAAMKEELIDRFGKLPQEAANLLLKIMLKILAVRAGVKRLDMTDTLLVLYFSMEHQKHPHRLVDLITARPDQFSLTQDHILKYRFDPSAGKGAMVQAKNILKEISQHVNS